MHQLLRSRFVRTSLAAFAAGLPVRARSETVTTLRVASTASDSYASALYAQDTGTFARFGLQVDLSILASGSAITAAVAGGAVDIGVTNPIPLAVAVAHGLPFRYICSGGLYNPKETALCVAADAPIHTGKDLEGKPIACTSLTDINTVAIKAWVDQNGGSAARLQFVEIPFSAMAPALRRGTVVAAPIVEPTLSSVLKEGGIRELMPPFHNVYGLNFMVGGWFATSTWIDRNRPTAQRFVQAIYSVAAWANAHPRESGLILAKYAKLDPSAVLGMNRAPYGRTLTPELIQPVLDVAATYGILDHPMAATELIERP